MRGVLELGDELLERRRADGPVPFGRRRRRRGSGRTRRPHGPSRARSDGPCCRPSCRARRIRSACLELLLDRVDVADGHAHGREAVVAQRLQIAVRLGSDQRAEGVGLAGDLEVLGGLVDESAGSGRSSGRPCGTGRSSAGSAGRSPTWWRPRSARSAAARSARDGGLGLVGVRQVAHDRVDTPAVARPSVSSLRLPSSRPGEPSWSTRLVLSLASWTLGWSNGLISSTQPATATANSRQEEDPAEVGRARARGS